MGRIIGIDLGTTNCCMAVMMDGKPVVITNAEGGMITPSVVAISKTGEKLVGEAARRQAVTNPENTFMSVMRDIGTTGNDRIMEGRKYAPWQIVAMILRKLKEDAEKFLWEKVSEAVIAVPSSFTVSQRSEIKDAAELAGLEVKRIISATTAAALAYIFDNSDKEEKFMVFDLGGGNLSVSIIEYDCGVVETLAVNGNMHLGGDDFDNRIVRWMLDEFKKVEGVDLSGDKVAVQRMQEAAEKAKKELSGSMTANIHLPYITTTEEGVRHFDRDLTRAKFEELTCDLVEKIVILKGEVMGDAEITNEGLNRVLLTGGSSRMSAVQEKIRQLTGKEPGRMRHPDECVAIGASIQAGKLMGEAAAGDILLLDVIPHSLSIETMGGVATRLIERNTTIPTRHSQIFSTGADNQTAVDINVVQGEERYVKDNISIATFRLDGIPPTEKGVPQIEVTFDIDTNGILNVYARDLNTGKEAHVSVDR